MRAGAGRCPRRAPTRPRPPPGASIRSHARTTACGHGRCRGRHRPGLSGGIAQAPAVVHTESLRIGSLAGQRVVDRAEVRPHCMPQTSMSSTVFEPNVGGEKRAATFRGRAEQARVPGPGSRECRNARIVFPPDARVSHTLGAPHTCAWRHECPDRPRAPPVHRSHGTQSGRPARHGARARGRVRRQPADTARGVAATRQLPSDPRVARPDGVASSWPARRTRVLAAASASRSRRCWRRRACL